MTIRRNGVFIRRRHHSTYSAGPVAQRSLVVDYVTSPWQQRRKQTDSNQSVGRNAADEGDTQDPSIVTSTKSQPTHD